MKTQIEIILTGKATVKDSDNYEITNFLDQFSDIKCEYNFVDYIDDYYPLLVNAGLSSGYMSFNLNKTTGQLETVTTYISEKILSEEALKELIKYTQGQWSDGIGEAFEQVPVYKDYYISPWHFGQTVTVEQFAIVDKTYKFPITPEYKIKQ